MPFTRRGFVKAMGLGTAGALSSSLIIGRGREAAAFEPESRQEPYDDGLIRISSNENARGPGDSVYRAIEEAMSARMGRGYPPDYTNDLVDAIAENYGVDPSNVIVGTGSGPILTAATRAFTTPDRHLVTAGPSYGNPESAARATGVRAEVIRLDSALRLDIEPMAEAAVGAGMVFFCNPNNPTGTVHSAAVVEEFVRRVKRASPETRILIDEAYIDYSDDRTVETAAPITQEYPGVFITRSFSKAHGMAGLRVGYAIGQEETVQEISSAWHLGSMNTLSAAAAIASIQDKEHIEAERRENARVREFTLQAFREMGIDAQDSHANFLFLPLGMTAQEFRERCLELGVRVGRDFPPMQETHSRISLGTMEEMEAAVRVFRQVLIG